MTGGPRSAPLSRGFALFLAGETVSAFGSYITLLALQALVVLTLGGGTQEVGWLTASRWLPYLVLGLVVGAWVDRRPRRPVMIGTDLVRATILCLIPIAWWFGVLTLGLLLVLVMTFGVVSVINDAASQSFLTRLIPKHQLQPAHARIDAGNAVAQASGPAIAGGLVSLLTAPVAVLVDAVTYLFSAAVVAIVKVPEPPRERVPQRRFLAEVRDGVVWVYRDSGLASAAIAGHIWFAGSAVLGVVVAPYALRTLALTPFQFGVATALAGLGAVTGALATGRVGRALGTGGTIIGSYVLAAVAVVVMAGAGFAGFAGTGWLAVAVLGLGQCVLGVGMGLSNSHEMSYRQVRTPDDLQARTNITIRSLHRAVLVIVAPVAGLLAAQVGQSRSLLLAAVVFLAAGAVVFSSPMRTDRSTVDGPH